jgi:hypothetical protein
VRAATATVSTLKVWQYWKLQLQKL